MNNFLLASAEGGISFIVIMSIFTLVVFAAMIWLICLGQKGDSLKLKLKPKYIFLIVLAVGAAVRMAVAFSMRGLVGEFLNADNTSRTGYLGMFNIVNQLITNGFDGIWAANVTRLFYPITLYILSFFGSIGTLFSAFTQDSVVAIILLKLPFIISDIVLAYAVYKIASKYTNEFTGMAIGGFVALCPVFMLGSIWPSVYSFLAASLVFVVYFMLERKYIKLVVAYTISLLLCFEAIYILPVIAVFLIYAYIKKIIAYRSSDKKGNIWNTEFSLIAKLPVAVVVCLICSYLLSLPFALSYVGANPFAILYVLCLKPFNNFGYFTYNGLSLYTLFDRNGASLTLSFPTYVFSLLFSIAIIAVTLIIYLTKKNRANLVMLVSYLLLTLNVYFVDSSELTLLPFFAITLIAYVILKDKRMLQIVGIAALFTFLNATAVLLKSDYFVTNAEYVNELLTDNWMVMNIFASVIAVLCHIYYTFILLDVVMNGKIKKLNALDTRFSSSVKGLLKIKD